MKRITTIVRPEKLEPLKEALFEADIIVGKVANDATNPTITAYLNGIFGPVDDEATTRFVVNRLMTYKLTDQFCFLTQAAIDCLQKIEVSKHEF